MAYTKFYSFIAAIAAMFALYAAGISYTQHYTDKQRIETLERDISILKGQNIKLGQAAPNFELRGMDGKLYRLTQYFGEKEIVLYGWLPKCPHCLVVLPDFLAYEKNPPGNVQVLSITVARTEKEKQDVREFVKKHHLRSPVLFADDEFLQNYAPFATPCVWHLTNKGRYKKIYQGRDLVRAFLMDGT